MNAVLDPLNAISYGLQDYINMFSLTEDELNMRILDCYAGASCFAKEMADSGRKVVASDPLYALPIEEVKSKIDKAKDNLVKDLAQKPLHFVPPNQMMPFLREHEKKLTDFLEDFQEQKTHRYKPFGFPDLGFRDEEFDLALISHYLFTYTEEFTIDFHVKAIKELNRVANEVRIFPLVTHESDLSLYVGEVAMRLQEEGLGVEIRGVSFEIQRKGNAMMRIWSPSCLIAAHQQ